MQTPEQDFVRTDRLETLWRRFHASGITEKAIWEMTLEEKGLLLQLGIIDPFAYETPPQPTSEMTPETKGALLLWHLVHGNPLNVFIEEDAVKPGQKVGTKFALDFSGTNLNMLGLRSAKLRNGDFRRADARDAVLFEVDFTGSNLEEANLEGAYLGGALLRNCNLSNCTGFPFCRDALIDVSTYRRSDWTPATLRQWHLAGAKIIGLDEFPTEAIEAILQGFRLDTPPVFLSYGGCDSDVATQIATHLETNGVRVWFAPWDIDYGDDVVRKIEEGLTICQTFLILLSPEALERPWVRQELSSALSSALNKPGKEIVPIRFKPCELPAFLSTRKWLELTVPYIDPLNELCRKLRKAPIPRLKRDLTRPPEESLNRFLDDWKRLFGEGFKIVGGETMREWQQDARERLMVSSHVASKSTDEGHMSDMVSLINKCKMPLGLWGEWPSPPEPKPLRPDMALRMIEDRFPEFHRMTHLPNLNLGEEGTRAEGKS